ncbi:unnamed protein product [Prunus armeniaca]
MEHKPLIRNGRYNNPMIDRYQEMQSSYVHEKCQVDLIEHLWEMEITVDEVKFNALFGIMLCFVCVN